MGEKLGISNRQIQRIRNYDYRVMDVHHYRVEASCVPRRNYGFMFGFTEYPMNDSESENWVLHRKSQCKMYWELKGKNAIVVLHSDSVILTQNAAIDIATRIAVRTVSFTFNIGAWLLE